LLNVLVLKAPWPFFFANARERLVCSVEVSESSGSLPSAISPSFSIRSAALSRRRFLPSPADAVAAVIHFCWAAVNGEESSPYSFFHSRVRFPILEVWLLFRLE
jgi:hypothetical protein